MNMAGVHSEVPQNSVADTAPDGDVDADEGVNVWQGEGGSEDAGTEDTSDRTYGSRKKAVKTQP